MNLNKAKKPKQHWEMEGILRRGRGIRAEDGYFAREGYDAVVVGSGYGGSVASCRLAKAGAKVCLIEKGRRWEALHFPTNDVQVISELRIESRNYGISFGPKDALFQIHDQANNFAGVICGLGGGSLINAGIMAPTPARVKKDPRWPKEWLKDWATYEANAMAILKPQDAPVQFASTKALISAADQIEESGPSPMKQSVNFELHENSNPEDMKHLDPCVACGNCMSGCPYNAKASNDKNFIALAVEDGCTVMTECEVQYIVKESSEEYDGHGVISTKPPRRWRVYYDSNDYVTADFVVIAAGVLGTAQILFQSEKRGLKLSDKLGYGFSTNGNNFAYLAGSSTPMNGQGMDEKELSNVPFEHRPGPTITSSFTSSVGFTIQSGVVPKAYPHLLLKGLFTFGWPSHNWFLHGIIDKLKHMMGSKSTHGMLINLMGYDEGNGRITLDKKTEKIYFSAPQDPLLPRKLKAIQRISKKLGGMLFMSRYRSTSVHLLGGCNAAPSPSQGVCNANGQVFDPHSESEQELVHHGLYVCDASLIPCPIGVNPSLSILAAAEHVSTHLVEEALNYKSIKKPNGHICNGDLKASPYRQEWLNGIHGHPIKRLRPSNQLVVKEKMEGRLGGMPCAAYLIMKLNSNDQKGYNTIYDGHPILRGKVGGYVISEFLHKDKLFIIDGIVDMCSLDCRTPYTQYMHYRLLLASASGSRYILDGRKILNPFFLFYNAWFETRTLHITFEEVQHSGAKKSTNSSEEPLYLTGQLQVSMFELLRSVVTMRGNKKGTFIYQLLQSFFQTYALQVPRLTHVDFGPTKMNQPPYPPCILHEIRTGDGFVITCKQWMPDGGKKSYPVMLLNGYSTESFWLPTEPRDLIRTLLEEGYEPWLIQVRLHPMNSSGNFTFDDIAKFDIPAVFAKIRKLHGPLVKLHVIAHCIGGVSLHMSLLGGHISASDIVSISCTNSSMYFKVGAFSLFKMSPLFILLLRAILGKNTILPLKENLSETLPHQFLKFVFRLLPHPERCSCDECNVFSGIFGNTFWHQNITPTAHHFVHKESLPQVPLSGLSHLSKICFNGHAVNARGEDVYLIHPERLTLPTLYISGGRPILVSPETTLLAHEYMKLHQPKFHHRRVVVEGFGHSDLLIGEEAHKKVFPHMIAHMKLAEKEKSGENVVGDTEKYNNSKELISWADYASEEGGGFGAWVSVFTLLAILAVFVGFYLSRFGIK